MAGVNAVLSGIFFDGAMPPAVPTNFNATAGNAQVVLTWTASGGAAGYIIYRSTASGQEVLYKTVTGTSFTDAGLANGTTYYYKIAAVNSGGASALSGEDSAEPVL